MEQAAFWQEVKVVCCLPTPFLDLNDFFFSFSFYPCSLRSKIDSMFLSPSHSYFSFGIICGRLWGSLAVGYESSGGSSDFRLPTSVAIKSGGRPTRLLLYNVFFLLLGRLCSGRFSGKKTVSFR